ARGPLQGWRVPRPRDRSRSACLRSPEPRLWFPGGLSTTSAKTSCADPAGKRRHVERAEAIMFQPADIAVEEGAQVVHAVFEHRQAVDAAAEGEALPFFGVEAAIGDHARVDHPAAEHLHPAFLPPDLAPALLPSTSDDAHR